MKGITQYSGLLKKRYGVEFDWIAGCTATPIQVNYADAYDEVSMEAARRRFGHDIFTEVREETTDPLNNPAASPTQPR